MAIINSLKALCTNHSFATTNFRIILKAALVRQTCTMVGEQKRARTEDEQLVIGTHNGTFHCDEVLACFMLRQLPEYANAKILRSRNDDELRSKCAIIVDVGGEFDPERKWYDHHQKTFEGTLSTLRPELGADYKIRLSSAGLVYTFYGERIIQEILKQHEEVTLSDENLRMAYLQIYKNFICEIDAIDNGVPMFPDGAEPLYKISTNISARIGKLNPTWEDDDVTNDKRDALFEEAMSIAGQEFVTIVRGIGGSWIRAREYVREALKNAKSVYETGEILVLPRFCPWKVHLSDLEKQYEVVGIPKLVLFNEGSNWRVAGVPVNPDSFLGRKFLPKSWHGLRDEELSKIAGIPDLIFVHHSGFIGGAKSKEAALAMAIKSVEWKDDSDN